MEKWNINPENRDAVERLRQIINAAYEEIRDSDLHLPKVATVDPDVFPTLVSESLKRRSDLVRKLSSENLKLKGQIKLLEFPQGPLQALLQELEGLAIRLEHGSQSLVVEADESGKTEAVKKLARAMVKLDTASGIRRLAAPFERLLEGVEQP